MDEKILKNEESIVLALRSLYRQYGYLPYKMSKFEEYDLYQRNKDFLVSDRFITFNDTNGHLLALKPDVTISIIKNGDDLPGVKQKVCYNENVYRISKYTHRFKEIMQAGLECIGDIDLYDILEVLSLAAESLGAVCDDYLLIVSHLGILSDILQSICTDARFITESMPLIAEKNSHDLCRLAERYGIDTVGCERLTKLIGIHGDRTAVLSDLQSIGVSEASLHELSILSELLESLPCGTHIAYDFSLVNDLHYYNGFVFRGYLPGICDGVLSGGQYDSMMKKMGRKSGAVGFALYLDLLEQLPKTVNDADVDVLILYNDRIVCRDLMVRVKALIASGKSVSVQKSVPPKVRYRELLDLREEMTSC